MIALKSGQGEFAGLDGTPLSTFFTRLFEPQKLRTQSRRERDSYSEATAWLERFLKRPALLCDLTPAKLTRLQTFMAKQGIGPARVRVVKTKLSSLGKHAWRLGMLPSWEPTPAKKIKVATPAFLKDSAPAGTLAATFRDVLRPNLEQNQKAKTIAAYSAAIGQFDRHLGRYATIADLTEEKLAAYKQSLLNAGRSESLFAGHQTRIRAVARLLAPVKFADRRPAPRLPPPSPGSVREFFETVYRPIRMVGSDSTRLVEIRGTLRRLYHHHGGDLPLAELSDEICASFFTALLAQGIEAVTVNGHRARLFAIWRLAAEQGRIARDPRIKKLRENRDAPDAWSEEELQRILHAPKLVKWRRDIAGIPAAKLWCALLLVAYWTGLRRRSLLALRRSDVDLSTGWLNVAGSQIKNRRGKQFRLGSDAVAALKEIWLPERELLFPFSKHGKAAFAQFKRILEAAGIPPNSRKGLNQLHKIRRSVATITAVRRGLGAACDLLGHSSAEVTKRYIDPSKLPGQDATEFLPQLSGFGALQIESSGQVPLSQETKRTPLRFLIEAEELFAAGRDYAAAVSARVALERGLFLTTIERGCRSKKAKNIPDYLGALLSTHVIDKETHQMIRRIAKTANRAAHGRHVEQPQVAELIFGLRGLFTTLFSEKTANANT